MVPLAVVSFASGLVEVGVVLICFLQRERRGGRGDDGEDSTSKEKGGKRGMGGLGLQINGLRF